MILPGDPPRCFARNRPDPALPTAIVRGHPRRSNRPIRIFVFEMPPQGPLQIPKNRHQRHDNIRTRTQIQTRRGFAIFWFFTISRTTVADFESRSSSHVDRSRDGLCLMASNSSVDAPAISTAFKSSWTDERVKATSIFEAPEQSQTSSTASTSSDSLCNR